MTIQIVHIGDLHFGRVADIPVVEALESMLPDLRPDANHQGRGESAPKLTSLLFTVPAVRPGAVW